MLLPVYKNRHVTLPIYALHNFLCGPRCDFLLVDLRSPIRAESGSSELSTLFNTLPRYPPPPSTPTLLQPQNSRQTTPHTPVIFQPSHHRPATPPSCRTTLAKLDHTTMAPPAFLPVPSAFSPRVPLPPRRVSPRTRPAPVMVSSTVIGVGLATVTAAGVGAAFFFLRKSSSGSITSVPASAAKGVASKVKGTAKEVAGDIPDPIIDVNPLKEITAILDPPPQEEKEEEPRIITIPEGGIIGLGAPVKDPFAEVEEEPVVIEPMANLDSAGVDLNRYIPKKVEDTATLTKPIEQELAWAAGALSELPGYGGTIISDKNGKVGYADGPLLKESASVGFSVRGLLGDEDEIVTVDANSLSFLMPGAACAAIAPVGSGGAIIAIASSEKDFLGEKELRTVESVRSRLKFAFSAKQVAAAET